MPFGMDHASIVRGNPVHRPVVLNAEDLSLDHSCLGGVAGESPRIGGRRSSPSGES